VQITDGFVNERVFHCGLYLVRYEDSEDEDDDEEKEEEEDWEEVEADSSESDEEEEDEEEDDDGPSSSSEEEGGKEGEGGCEALKEGRRLARHCRLYGKDVKEGVTAHEKASVGLEAYVSSEDDEEEDETEDEDEEEADEEEMEKEVLLMVDVKPVLQAWARRSGLGFATSSVPCFGY
jgi:hypothetical protein